MWVILITKICKTLEVKNSGQCLYSSASPFNVSESQKTWIEFLELHFREGGQDRAVRRDD